MQVQKQILQLKSFSGINQAVPHTLIEDNQSIFMGNMQIDNGVLKKRNGYKLITTCVGESDISDLIIHNDEFYFIRKDSSNNTVVKYIGVKGDISDIPLSPVATSSSNEYFIKFNGELYLFTDLVLYKLGAGKFDKVEPYIPTVLTTCAMDGSGQYLEDMNLLSNKFKLEYSVPNTIPDKMSLPVSISITGKNGLRHLPLISELYCNGEKLVYLTDYTTGRANAQNPVDITFTTAGKAKITKGTNNIVAHCYFEIMDNTREEFEKRFRKISKCKIYTNYGGDNDTRMLASGNTDMKNCIFRSGVLDCTYFPENAFQFVGDNSEEITSFQKQYDCCLIFKKESIWRMEFHITSQGVVDYPVTPLNDNYGCTYMKASESIENNAVFLNNEQGLMRVFQSNQRGEANAGCISATVNKLKLNGYDFELMSDLPELAKYRGLLVSIRYPLVNPSMADDGEKLYIGCQKSIFVYDYKVKAWYVWNMQNKDISRVFIKDGKLCFISKNNIYMMKQQIEYPLTNKNESIKLYNDRENVLSEGKWEEYPIYSIWFSKQHDFGINEKKKTVDRIFIEMESLPRNSVDVYSLDKDNRLTLISEKINDLFGYNRIAYNRYGYNITPFPREMTIKYKAKKIGYFQLVFVNDLIDCASNVQSMDIRYKYNNYYK